MKKVVFVLIMICCYSISFSQKFIVTQTGLKDYTNPENGYLVVNFEDKTASKLYELTNKFCLKYYSSPKNAIQGSLINEFIKVKTYCENFIVLQKDMFGKEFFCDNMFCTSFSFKDNKVKIEIEQLEMYDYFTKKYVYFNAPNGISWGIFKKNGEDYKNFPSQYVDYYNKYVSDYIDFINKIDSGTNNW